MKIGILSDSHDNLPKILQAVERFNQLGAEFVIHCGDFIAPFSLKPLQNLKCDYVGVYGNNDGEKMGLQSSSSGRIRVEPATVELAGRKIAFLHFIENFLNLAFDSQTFDLICYGHTHQPRIEHRGKTLVVNPGECGGWLSGVSTIAMADLDKLEAEIIKLD